MSEEEEVLTISQPILERLYELRPEGCKLTIADINQVLYERFEPKLELMAGRRYVVDREELVQMYEECGDTYLFDCIMYFALLNETNYLIENFNNVFAVTGPYFDLRRQYVTKTIELKDPQTFNHVKLGFEYEIRCRLLKEPIPSVLHQPAKNALRMMSTFPKYPFPMLDELFAYFNHQLSKSRVETPKVEVEIRKERIRKEKTPKVKTPKERIRKEKTPKVKTPKERIRKARIRTERMRQERIRKEKPPKVKRLSKKQENLQQTLNNMSESTRQFFLDCLPKDEEGLCVDFLLNPQETEHNTEVVADAEKEVVAKDEGEGSEEEEVDVEGEGSEEEEVVSDGEGSEEEEEPEEPEEPEDYGVPLTEQERKAMEAGLYVR